MHEVDVPTGYILLVTSSWVDLMRNKLLIAILTAIGLAVRLTLAPFTGHGWDMYVWLKSGELFTYTSYNIYEISDIAGFPWGFYTYPPLWLYWLAAAQALRALLGLEIHLQVFLIKLPIILADVITGLLLYRLGQKLALEEKTCVTMYALFILNPLVIFISSVWGMFDSVATLFVILSLLLLTTGHECMSLFSLGVGAAVKIYPALFFPALLIYLHENKKPIREVLIKGSAMFFSPLIISSLPYLSSPGPYLSKIFFHISNVGQFNIWTLIKPFLSVEWISIISTSLLVFLYGYFILKNLKNFSKSGFQLRLFTGLLIIFLATSMKVNVQYMVWLIPLLLIDIATKKGRSREDVISYIIINAVGLVFIAAFGQFISFDLTSLGRVKSVVVSENFIAGGLILTSSAIAGWRFILMMLDHLNLTNVKKVMMGKVGISLILILFILSLSLFPSPAGIELPQSKVRIAVLESAHSVFTDGKTYLDFDEVDRLGRPNIIVLPFSIDFFNLYDRYDPELSLNKYMKFRIDTSELKASDLRRIVSNLKNEGIRVTLGVFIAPEQRLVSYGIHGYSADWLINNHPEVLRDGKIQFGEYINESGVETRYSTFVAKKIRDIVMDFGFDGVYILTEPEGIRTVKDLEALLPLLVDVRKEVGDDKVLFIDRVDPFLSAPALRETLNHVDYLVIHTSPWIDGMLYGTRANRTIETYQLRIRQLKNELPRDVWPKLLYTVYTLDMTNGWLTPALEVQLEVDSYSGLLESGYAVYYASNYLPYRLKLRAS